MKIPEAPFRLHKLPLPLPPGSTFAQSIMRVPPPAQIAQTLILCLRVSGIFPLISRLNHSCAPNAALTWCPSRRAQVLRATRDVGVGEEVVVAYVRVHNCTRAHRKDVLSQRFGFACACAVCLRPEWASDDDARTRIDELSSHLAQVRMMKRIWAGGSHSSASGVIAF